MEEEGRITARAERVGDSIERGKTTVDGAGWTGLGQPEQENGDLARSPRGKREGNPG